MKNQIIKLTCIDMSVDGQGICKHEGLVIFVKGMILHETANVKIISHKKNLAYGIIDELLEPSPYRIKSNCPVSYKCGGCDYRYIDYDYQLYLKKKSLIQTFRNFNLDVEVKDVLPSPKTQYYRNKTQIPVADSKFGFYRKYSNDIVEFDNCYIETELANEILNYLKPLILKNKLDTYLRHIIIKHCIGTDEVMIAFIVSKFADFNSLIEPLISKYPNIKSIILNLNDKDTNVVLGTTEKVIYGRDYVIDEFENLKFKLSLKSFYQVNYHQMINLYTLAKDLAKITKEDSVLDLYSGIGTISLFVSKYAKDVTGVEVVPSAVENARENAVLNNITNTTFYLDDAKNPMDKYINGKDVVIVDPPRKGLSSSLVESLKKADIKKLVYISCGPSTLARDLALLKDYYHFDTIYPVDMFPYTVHVEAVVLLRREKVNGYIDINVKPQEMAKIQHFPENDNNIKDSKKNEKSVDMSPAKRKTAGVATYQEIKDYVFKNYGLKVSCLNIGKVKADYGITERKNYNTGKDGHKVPNTPKEKYDAIVEAFRYFKMI